MTHSPRRALARQQRPSPARAAWRAAAGCIAEFAKPDKLLVSVPMSSFNVPYGLAAYRELLRRLGPRVFVDGRRVERVADDPAFAPGINAVGITYDFALAPEHAALMTARQATSGKTVNRMLHVNETSTDLLTKLEAVRLVCRESGCAQRYIAHDMFNALFQATRRADESAATFSGRYGQSTGVVLFDDVFVPWHNVFLAGEVEEAGYATTAYATHHRHSCIGARAGFGDLLIGAGALMIEANGLDPSRHAHVRDAMVELIKIVEGFFACGVAASVYAIKEPGSAAMPDPVFANVGKLLLATQIYDMHRLAHYVSGGLVVSLPGPDEDHNPEPAASLAAVLAGRPDIPAAQRLQVARLVEDLTASYQGGWYSIISLHGGGSPEAMKREIWRNYPLAERTQLVERLLERGVADEGRRVSKQPGRCCVTGCEVPEPPRKAAAHGG